MVSIPRMKSIKDRTALENNVNGIKKNNPTNYTEQTCVEDGSYCLYFPVEAVEITGQALDFIVHPTSAIYEYNSSRHFRASGCNVQRRQTSDRIPHKRRRFSNNRADEVNNLRGQSKGKHMEGALAACTKYEVCCSSYLISPKFHTICCVWLICKHEQHARSNGGLNRDERHRLAQTEAAGVAAAHEGVLILRAI
jgi:hypothetical protein